MFSSKSPFLTFIPNYGLLRPCALHRHSHPYEVLSFKFLPWHQDGRFPRSTQKPGARSHHLNAGRRSD